MLLYKKTPDFFYIMLVAENMRVIHVDVNRMCNTNQHIIVDQIHPMPMVFPDESGGFQQKNAPSITAQIVHTKNQQD